MRALVYEGAKQLAMREMPDPVAGEGEVLVRVDAVGICGSDMHAWLGHDERRVPPLILGHEAAGVVASGPRTGERVTVNPLVSCQRCSACRAGRENLCPDRKILSMTPKQGAFCELIAIQERNLVAIPDGVSSQRASLAEPLACSWHGAVLAERLLHRPLQEARCLVLGGGAIGLGSALCLAARGATDITIAEPNPLRHPLLKKAGDFNVVRRADDIEVPHLVVDAYGGESSRRVASDVCAPGGAIVHIGLAGGEAGLDTRRMTLQEISFTGSYTYTHKHFVETAEAIFDGRLGALDWMAERPLDEGPQAFADILDGKAPEPKIILIP